MANEFLKGVVVGGLLGGGGGQREPSDDERRKLQRERYEAERAQEQVREREEEFRHFQAEAHRRQLDRQAQQLSELQSIEWAVSSQTPWLEQLAKIASQQHLAIQELNKTQSYQRDDLKQLADQLNHNHKELCDNLQQHAKMVTALIVEQTASLSLLQQHVKMVAELIQEQTASFSISPDQKKP